MALWPRSISRMLHCYKKKKNILDSFLFKKINRFIVLSINQFFVNFSAIFMVLVKQDC
jgi:hypothetical protein